MTKIREGYKETEIGIIPEDWEVVELGEIGQFRKGKGIKKDEVLSEGLSCIRYGEIYTTYNHVVRNTKSFISDETAEDSMLISKNELIFAGSGETVEDIGKAVVYLSDKTCYVGGDTIIMKPASKISGMFLSYYLATNSVIKQKRKLGQGNSIVHIYVDGVKSIKVPIPSEGEQKFFAELLSITDEHIEKLDKTIKDYQLLKKAIMKKLLSEGIGHTEFKETEIGRVPKAWEVKVASQVFHTITDFVASGSFATLRENVEYKDSEDYALLIRLTDFKNDYKGPFVYVTENAYKFLKKSNLMPNEIIISNVGAYAGFVFRTRDLGKPMTLGPNAILVRSDQCCDYLYYWLSSDIGQVLIRNILSTTAQPKFNKTDFRKILISLPPNKEQNQIASIFLSLDNRINLYQQERSDFTQLKKALMEQLMTGKIRVKV